MKLPKLEHLIIKSTSLTNDSIRLTQKHTFEHLKKIEWKYIKGFDYGLFFRNGLSWGNNKSNITMALADGKAETYFY